MIGFLNFETFLEGAFETVFYKFNYESDAFFESYKTTGFNFSDNFGFDSYLY
jgi:hypothetical protein